MAIRGMKIYKTNDLNIADTLASYIWQLNFKKSVRVDVAIYDDENISATLSKTSYVVTVNPESKLEDIKEFLLKKGYITN